MEIFQSVLLQKAPSSLLVPGIRGHVRLPAECAVGEAGLDRQDRELVLQHGLNKQLNEQNIKFMQGVKTNSVFFKQFTAFPFLAPCGRLQEICCQQNRSMQLEQLCECLRYFFLFFQNLSVITQKPSLNSKIRSEILTGDLRGIQSMFQI